MSTLYLTVGLPQSGKSTWAKEQGYPIVNRDSIRFAIGGSIRYFKEEARVSEIEKIMVKSLFKAGHDKVIVDATHLKKKYVEAWEEFAKTPIWRPYRDEELSGFERNYLIILQRFFTPVEVCIERAQRNFPKETNFPAVIRSMWESAETIDIPEFKEIVTNGESG
jgi:predicted kinase